MDEAALRRVRGLVLDVDGVLTDAGVWVGGDGHEMKRFSILDGTAIYWCRLLGFEIALVSGRSSPATARRAAELGIEAVYQGVRDKAARVAAWATEKGLELDEVMYMGDDHIDLPVFERVGVAVAPGSADPEIRAAADHVTTRGGGEGAVREAIRWLLESSGRMDEAIARYRASLEPDGNGPR